LLDIRLTAACPSLWHWSAFLVVDGGEQRGVGADQRGALRLA
jgi:hypothetical protein